MIDIFQRKCNQPSANFWIWFLQTHENLDQPATHQILIFLPKGQKDKIATFNIIWFEFTCICTMGMLNNFFFLLFGCKLIYTLSYVDLSPDCQVQRTWKKSLSFSFLSVKARVDLLGSLAWVANIYSPKIQWILLWFALHCSCSYFYCLARKAALPLLMPFPWYFYVFFLSFLCFLCILRLLNIFYPVRYYLSCQSVLHLMLGSLLFNILLLVFFVK